MMDQGTTNLLFGVLGSVATALGVGIAWYFNRRSSLLALEQMHRDNAAFAMELMRDIRSWADEVIHTLSKAAYQSKEMEIGSSSSETSSPAVVRLLESQLSSLVERGRLFFPNSHKDSCGMHKLPAYRGIRHAALDSIVASIKVLEGTLGNHQSKYIALTEMRKVFVSTIQPILGPDQNNRLISTMIERYDNLGKSDKTMGGLIATSIASGATALLHPSK
jgi:hypothetical protein